MNKAKFLMFSSTMCSTILILSCANRPKELKEINATTEKTEFRTGDVLSKDDIKVVACYDNKYTQNVKTWECDDFNEDNLYMYTFTNEDADKHEKIFNIKYVTKTVAFKVNVGKPVTKTQWLDEYGILKEKFQQDNLEYSIRNIELLHWNNKNVPISAITTKYVTDTSRKFNILFTVSSTQYTLNCGAYITKEDLANNLEETNGVFEVFENYINYYNTNESLQTGKYSKLSFRKDGYLIEQNIKDQPTDYIKVKYRGELHPKTITKTEWLEKYTEYSKTFAENYSKNSKYVQFSPIKFDGYIDPNGTKKFIKPKLINNYPFTYATAPVFKSQSETVNVPVFQVKFDDCANGFPFGGYIYDYRVIEYQVFRIYESSYDIEYYLDNDNNKAEFICYNKLFGTKTVDFVFNSNGYIEKYYQAGSSDLTVTYPSLDDRIETKFSYAAIETDAATQEIINAKYGFASSTNPLTLLNNKTYLFSMYSVFIDVIEGTTINSHFSVEKLSFKGDSLTDLTSIAEEFKVYVEGQEVPCTTNGTFIVIDEGHIINTRNTNVSFQIKMKQDFTFNEISTNGNVVK